MTEQVQAQPSTLEFTDIDNATRIIKAAIERGAFQAEEMSGVAAVYDKFRVFRDEVVAANAPKEDAPVEGDVVEPVAANAPKEDAPVEGDVVEPVAPVEGAE